MKIYKDYFFSSQVMNACFLQPSMLLPCMHSNSNKRPDLILFIKTMKINSRFCCQIYYDHVLLPQKALSFMKKVYFHLNFDF